MRYLMALMLVWGVCQFSSAQTDQNQNTDCPPKVEGQTENEGVEMDNADADLQYEDDAYVRGNESEELQDPKSDFDAADAETEFDMESDIESDEAEIDAETDFDAADAETAPEPAPAEAAPADTGMSQDQSKECPNVDETTSDAGDVTYETTNVIVVEEQEQERSTLGKIWRSPFKLIGNIPKAAVSIVSESAEGVGHIVGAPFKGVGKLFGAEENDDKGLGQELDEEIDENI
jgi:hypothetical protein